MNSPSKPEAKPACPLCEHVALSFQALAWHLVNEHRALERNRYKGKYTGTVRCWCKSWFQLGPDPAPAFQQWTEENVGSRFARHLEIVAGKEGLAAHILEATLGRH
jgi:hypothetical protein